MIRLPFALLLLLAAIASASSLEASFPGVSRVGLTPPGKMTASRRMNGFEDVSGNASLVIAEFPAQAYPEIAAGFTKDALDASGLRLVSRGKLGGVAWDNMLIVADQPVEGVALRRYVMVARLPDVTGLVTLQAPKGSKDYAEPAIRKALASLVVRPELTSEQQLAGLPFRMGDLAAFRFVRTLAGNAVLLTDGPLDRIEGAAQPSIVIASSLGPVPAGDERASFGRRALQSLPQTKDLRIDTDRITDEGGVPVGEITGSARHSETGELMTVYQAIRFGPTGYVRLVGRGRLEAADALLPRFRTVWAGLTTP